MYSRRDVKDLNYALVNKRSRYYDNSCTPSEKQPSQGIQETKLSVGGVKKYTNMH